MRGITSFIGIVFLLMAAPSWAITIHVPADYSTIQGAITAASNDDEVLVADGTYIENIDFEGKAIAVRSENGPEMTTIGIFSSGVPVVAFDSGEDAGSILEGFTIEGDLSYWGVYCDGTSPIIYNNIITNHEVGIYANGGHPTIRKNEITLCHHSDLSPNNGGGIRLMNCSDVVIDSNTIHDNYADVSGGIHTDECENITIERNLIYSNECSYVSGIKIDRGTGFTVSNNTLVNNSATDPLGVILFWDSNNLDIYNNIVAYNSEWGIYNWGSSDNYEIDYNCLYDNSLGDETGYTPEVHNVYSDPMFTDLGNFDLNLTEYSPCINAGDPSSPLDPDGSRADIGALYFQGGTTPDGDLEWIGSVATPGNTYGVDIVGQYAYTADYYEGMSVIDISDPANPVIVGRESMPGRALDIRVSGNYAYCSDDGDGSLSIIDISDPANPTLTSTLYTDDRAYSLDVDGNHAFVADGEAGVQVVDVSDPYNPFIIDNIAIPTGGVFVEGNFMYVVNLSIGLTVVDVSDPSNCIILGSVPLSGFPRKGVRVRDGYAYVAIWETGLEVVDVSDPNNPFVVGLAGTPGNAMDVDLNGAFAFVAEREQGLTVVDISNPNNPLFNVHYPMEGTIHGVYATSEYVYVADGNSLEVFRRGEGGEEPTEIELVGSVYTPGNTYGIYVVDELAYTANYYEGMSVIDVSDHSNPTIIGNESAPGRALDIKVSDNYAYLSDDLDGSLSIVNVSEPTNPTLISTLDTPDRAYSLFVDGNICYVADGETGILVVDITDPNVPTVITTLSIGGSTGGIFVEGNYAYIVDHFQGLIIADVTNPEVPVVIGNSPVSGHPRKGIKVRNGFAYVAVWETGLDIFDVSDPTNPIPVGNVTTPGNAMDVALMGDYAYIADWGSGLTSIDISDPHNPVFDLNIPIGGDADGVFTQGEFIYIVNVHSLLIFTREGAVGELALDIGDVYGEPGQPVEVPITGWGFGDTEIAGVEMHLGYDVGCLEYTNIVSDYLDEADINVVDGQIHVIWDDYLNPFMLPDESALITIQFTILGELGQVCEIGWMDPVEIVNPLGDPLTGIDFLPGYVEITTLSDIAGNVTYYDMATPVADVTVNLEGELERETATDELGDYLFESLWPGFYGICAWKDADDPGVTVNDIVKMRRHIVYIESLDSPYKMVAADVNQNGGVTVADVIKIRRYLAELDELPSGNWTFIASDFEINEENWPDAPGCIEAELAYENLEGLDFTGIRMGDVDISWPDAGLILETVTDSVSLCLNDTEASAGEIVTMPVTVTGFTEIAGLEIHIEFPEDLIEANAINHDVLDQPTTNIADGEIHLIWDNIFNTLTLEDNEQVISIDFEVPEDAPDIIPISFTSSYVTDDCGSDFIVETADGSIILGPTELGDESNLPTTYSLNQNYPNPFNATTTIEYALPEPSQVKIEIYNILGHKVETLVDDYLAAGYYQIIWRADVSSGIYFYKIQADDFNNTKKMLMLK